MQENREFSLENRKERWYDRPGGIAGLVLALALLAHFSVLGVLAALYTRPDYRPFWWFPALLGAMCLFLAIRLCLHLFRRHRPNSIDV